MNSIEAWPDVVARAFESRCGSPPLTHEELSQQLPADCTHAVVLGSACLGANAAAPLGNTPLEIHHFDQCFEMVASPHMVNSALEQGAYQITPIWLANWRQRLLDLGFDPAHSVEFFQDFAQDLVLYDTGVDASAPQRLQDMAQALGLPSRQVAVGLDHIRHNLSRLVFDWRLQEQKRQSQARERQHKHELADYAVAMDLLTQLAQSPANTPVIDTIENLFQMLFAPRVCRYLPLVQGQLLNPRQTVPAELLQTLPDLTSPWVLTPSDQGFLLSVSHGQRQLGVLVVEGLSFPQFRQRYLNLALAMVGVCALTIDQAQAQAELKTATEKLAQSQMQVLQSEKLAVIGQIAAGVAHEINNPIGFVNSNLGSLSTYVTDLLALIDALALNQTSPSAQNQVALKALQARVDLAYLRQDVGELLAESKSGLERVRDIVQNLRNFSRIDSKDWDWVNLNTGLDSTLSIVFNELKYKANIIKNYGELALVRCQVGQINQVFLNLLVNAGQSIDQHGTVTISSGMRDDWAWVSVQDTGCGITPEVQERIFEPFFTTKPVGQGTGLGLALAHDIVDRHHGRLEVHSVAGQGSTLTVWLPVDPPTADAT